MAAHLRTATFVALLAFGSGCTGDDQNPESTDPAATVTTEDVVASYAQLVYINYVDARDEAIELQHAIDTFVADPGPGTHEMAKRAYLEARVPYAQTEAFRFYHGPIDDPDTGPEPLLNAWPLDEIYIDYVEGNDTAGIVNDPSIELTKDKLVSLSEGGEGDVLGLGDAFDADKAISVGYHAIEFLLWGQDHSTTGPGERPWQDYLTTMDATAPNGDRRGKYLQIAAELIVDQLNTVVDAWAPGGGNYREQFVSGDPDAALRKMITSLGILSKGELGGERMDVALDSLDQEDEHSCFSDNTAAYLAMDALGIQNVYLGRYGYFDGPGIDDLVEAVDPDVNAKMRGRLEASIVAIHAIPPPFDVAISKQGSDGWNKVNAAVNALFDQGDTVVEVAQALGLGSISVELPE